MSRAYGTELQARAHTGVAGSQGRPLTSESVGVTTPKTDRRMDERFDVLGSLWGVLEIPETAAVVNSSETGMLVETEACPVLDSVQLAHVAVDGVPTTVQSSVRHVRPIARGKYLVGLEYVKPPMLGVRPTEKTEAPGEQRPTASSAESGTGLDT